MKKNKLTIKILRVYVSHVSHVTIVLLYTVTYIPEFHSRGDFERQTIINKSKKPTSQQVLRKQMSVFKKTKKKQNDRIGKIYRFQWSFYNLLLENKLKKGIGKTSVFHHV